MNPAALAIDDFSHRQRRTPLAKAPVVAVQQRANDPIDRAKLATEARDLAEALVEETILDANRAGITWRELGAGLGVPFQTLYRRYGANR